MPILEFNNFIMNYDTAGTGSPAIIFIHGIGGGTGVWKYQVDYLKDKYKTISVDLFDHGQSSFDVPPEDSINLNAGAILRIVEQEQLKRYILVGHSYAGNIIPEIIRRADNRLRGIVFVDCIYQNRDDVIEMREKFGKMMLAHEDSALYPETKRWYLEMTYGRASQEDMDFIVSTLENCNLRAIYRQIIASCEHNRKFPHNTTPVKDDVEVLVVEADKGDIGGFFYKSWINRFKNGRYYLFEKSNHFLFVTDRIKFNRLLGEFIEEIA